MPEKDKELLQKQLISFWFHTKGIEYKVKKKNTYKNICGGITISIWTAEPMFSSSEIKKKKYFFC